MEGLVRAFRRGDHEVVLGIGSASPQLISGLTERESAALVRLGALSPSQWQAAGSTRPPSKRWRDVLDIVASAAGRIAAPAPTLGSLIVTGPQRLVEAVAPSLVPLAHRVLADRLDVDRIETALLTGTSPVQVDLAVLLTQDLVPPDAARVWHAHGIPHLPVLITCDGLIVGPLVRVETDPCMHCLDLHRHDHDPAWARIAAQSVGPEQRAVLPPADLLALAAGLTGTAVRGMAMGSPLPSGVTICVRPPRLDAEHRKWHRHPACPRHRERAA